jgi:hypothetical protein
LLDFAELYFRCGTLAWKRQNVMLQQSSHRIGQFL